MSVVRDQARLDQLIEAVGPDLARLAEAVAVDACAVMNIAARSLFDADLTDAEREFVIAGALIGPAVTAAVRSGATEDGFMALVNKLFRDCKAQIESN